MKYVVTINGKKYEVEVEKVAGGEVSAEAKQPVAAAKTPSVAKVAPKAQAGGQEVKAPMPGTILDVKVAQGAKVKSGDVLLILEAMKMENEILAEVDGTVEALNVEKGSKVSNGDVLVVIS